MRVQNFIKLSAAVHEL